MHIQLCRRSRIMRRLCRVLHFWLLNTSQEIQFRNRNGAARDIFQLYTFVSPPDFRMIQALNNLNKHINSMQNIIIFICLCVKVSVFKCLKSRISKLSDFALKNWANDIFDLKRGKKSSYKNIYKIKHSFCRWLVDHLEHNVICYFFSHSLIFKIATWPWIGQPHKILEN